jgi:1,4-dihydroxy-2-naphthoate octaprenyltransferase
MSNMTVNQRNQDDRATYGGSAERIRRGSERGAMAFSLVAFIVAGVLCYAAAEIMNGWWQFVIMGAIAMTAVGLMIAVSPNRRG